jgi:trk system potassium uptake protein TrkH|tara:strand:+ start:1037 stop:2518 length:1482 start_codon:yes stop_codon:yes gene_type:complete
MNFSIIFRAISYLLIILSIAMGFSFFIGWISTSEHNNEIATKEWILSLSITLFSAFVLLFFSRSNSEKKKDRKMLRKEAIAIAGIAWIVCGIHAALPYVFCDIGISFDQCFFEAISGLTTTGSTVLNDLNQIPKTLLVWRSTTQWLGGLGIVMIFLLIQSRDGASGKMMFGAESSLPISDLNFSNFAKAQRSLWTIYICLTIICALGYRFFGMTNFQAINHALTTTATGGFSTENNSFSNFSQGAKIWAILFMLICSISLFLYLVIIKKRKTSVLKENEEARWFLVLLISAIALILINNRNIFDQSSILDTLFNVVAISTSTGYVSGDYDAWPTLSKEILLILMVIGGCSGSTAGGMKVSRILLWFRFIRSELTRTFRPQMESIPRMVNSSKSVDKNTLGQLFVIFTASFFFLILGSLLMHAIEPDISIKGCIASVVTTLCNNGPAFAEFGPTKNFSHISTTSTIMLTAFMILGRLGFVYALVLFSRKLWKHY